MKKEMFCRITAIVLVLIFSIILTACDTLKLSPGSSEALTLSSTDYSNPDNWLRFGGDGSFDVDIFVVYPTVTFIDDDADRPFVRIDNPLMRERAEWWLDRVDSIITPAGNVYAPLYNQLNGLMLASLSSDEFDSFTFAAPRNDIFAAFDYYLENVNKGERPFILFGHSQGAALVAELASLFLGNEKYYEHNSNHIITYAAGFSITQAKIDRNPNLSFSQSPTDHRMIVTWNTTAPSEIASGAVKRFGTWHPDALVTNPISWTTDETLVHAADNLPSLVPQFDGSLRRVENYANAIVDMEHRVLVTTTVPESDYASGVPNIGIFHQYDMTLFNDSIAANILKRIETFKR